MSSGASILLIDDNPAVAKAMEIAFELAGRKLDVANSPEVAYSRLAVRKYDAILLDLNFSPGQSSGTEGLACLARLTSQDPDACVLVITAHSGIRIAVSAMQAGARDFVMKPWRNAELVSKVEAAIACGSRSMFKPADRALQGGGTIGLIGESAAIQRLRELVGRIGPTSASMAVTGRPGSGRNLTALALHAASQNAADVLRRIDARDDSSWCELSRLEGTVVLRHPDRLSELAQAHLLDHLHPDLRCISVANTTEGFTPAMRRRLATVELKVPALSEREGDALLLARHFMRCAADQHGRDVLRLTPAAEAAISETAWQDEVRGLALAIERAVLLADTPSIDVAALLDLSVAEPSATFQVQAFDLDAAEKATIEKALLEYRHNVSRAAAALGLSRGTLYRRMARHGL